MTTPLDDDTLPTDGEAALDALRETVDATSLRIVDVAGETDVGLVRTENEDAFAIEDGFVAVSDGMGGHEGGALAARTAVRALLQRDSSRGWRATLRAINDEVRSVAREAGYERAGATIVAALVSTHHAAVIWAGDSRVFRVRGNDLELLTSDHTLRQELYAAGIDDDRQRGRGLRLDGLTSYLGAPADRFRCDVQEIDLAEGDRLLLCSDGVHRSVPPAELATAVRAPTCAEGVELLLGLARVHGGRDNATAILLEVGQ